MLAHHPLTGQEIRILRTDSHISTSLKTLVWFRSTMKPSFRWSRWFSVISEPISTISDVTAVIIPKDDALDTWMPILPTLFKSDSTTLLFAYNSTLVELERRGFSWQHTCVIDDLYDSYPFLGEPLQTGAPVEKIILSIAHILRMNKIVWSSPVERDALDYTVRIQYDAWLKHCEGVLGFVPLDGDDSVIPHTTLLIQYFRHPVNQRFRELRSCLEKNIVNPYIDSILLLNETELADLPKSEKIKEVVIGHRLTYFDVYSAIFSHVKPGGFAIYANADIYFNDTLAYLWKIPLLEKRLFLALLRWEETNGKTLRIFGPRSDSQDCWILARDAVDFVPSQDELGFPFGKSGCDNAITMEMLRKRFLVVNPAYSIKTVHLHTSNIRNYDPKDVLYKPNYMYVDPTAIQPCGVERNLKEYAKIPTSIQHTWSMNTLRMSFPRPILSVSDDKAKTLCAMLRRDEHTFQMNEKNLWTPPPQRTPLYHFTGGIFVTKEGLLSNCKTLFVGQHKQWITQWEHVQQSSMMSSILVPSMIAAPLSEESRSSLSRWVLNYLPRALSIRRLIQTADLGKPEFLVPQFPELGSFLNDCSWNEMEKGNITVLPILDDMNYFSNDVWAIPPDDTDVAFSVSSEDIQLLRSLLPVEPKAEDMIVVFCVDDDETTVCTRGWAEEVAEHLFNKRWLVRYVSVSDSPSTRRKAFASASWIIGSSNNHLLDWMWQNQSEATVMEFMPIEKPVADHIHLAGASQLRYIVGLVQKEPIVFQRQNALLEVGQALRKFGFHELLKSSQTSLFERPRIVVPSAAAMTGIWSQKMECFREMIDIWAQRKYITCEQSDNTTFCWWGGIGSILLYDFPTTRWWSEIPSYQMALFGNPPPPGPDAHVLRQSSWSFWARSPRKIESLVAHYEHLRGYNSRTIPSIFLGKIENGIQMKHRTAVDWSSSCSLFSMPIDSTGEPYPYTQKEYLEKVCSSRFGLCLPGFGAKCNREIEYFACGTVPILTPGVDMKHYLVPPRVGIHYFYAETPDDVKRIVETTSSSTWSTMSAAGHNWWRAYASAEGLFRLTWARIEQCRPYLNVGIPRNFP